MLTMALIKTLGMIILLHAVCSPQTISRLCGQYRKWMELFIILIYPIPFLATGTITGALVAMLSGVFLSMYLESRKHLVGYQYKDQGQWHTHGGILAAGLSTTFNKFWYGEH